MDYLKVLKLKQTFNPEYLLINCGLHDIKTNTKTGKKQISIGCYISNLDSIINITKEMSLKLIWINTTPVCDSIHNTKNMGFYRFNKDVELYNKISDSICKVNNIPIIDLYSFSSKFPLSAYKDHVHYESKYQKLQALYITEFIKNTIQ